MPFLRHRSTCLVIASLLAACQPTPTPATTPPVATLNGEPVSRALLEQMAHNQRGARNHDAQSPAPAASAVAVDRQQLLDELLNIELLAQKARERGLGKDPSVLAESELQAKTLLAQRVVRELIDGVQVSDAELQALYEEQIPPHEFQLHHIPFDDQADADAAMAKLHEGQRFDALAKRLGGSLGWAMMDQMPPDFAAVIKTLKPGEHSPRPFKTGDGWHLVQLRATRPVERPSLQTARVWLHPQLVHAKVQAQQLQWRERATIQLSPASTTLAAEPPLPAGVVATVNGQPLPRSLLDELAKTRRTENPDRARILGDLVTVELLSQRAQHRPRCPAAGTGRTRTGAQELAGPTAAAAARRRNEGHR